jgi:hypothetical protein
VGRRQDEFSMVGIERVVPLRFVILTTSATDADIPTWEKLTNWVRLANSVHRQAGIQYSIESARTYVTPQMAGLPPPTTPPDPPLPGWTPNNEVHTWPSVKSELAVIYPSMLTYPNLPVDGIKKTVDGWLFYAATRFADPTQVVVNVWAARGGGGVTALPWQARAVNLGSSSSESVLAHELGHLFGLFHSQGAIGGVEGFPANLVCDPSSAVECNEADPSKPGMTTMADWWDQVYLPGSGNSPHTFFHSRAEAQAAGPANLLWINKTSGAYDPPPFLKNCVYTFNNNSTDNVICDVGPAGGRVETISTTTAAGADKLQGLVRPTSDGRLSRNIMMGNETTPPGIAAGYPFSLSNAQVKLMRRNLRYDMAIQAYREPDLNALGMTGGRPVLGRAVRRPPMTRLDLDGDSKRDLVLWVPPPTADNGTITGHGTFSYYLSSESYSTLRTLSNVHTGVNGDTPMAADFDEDSRTDLGIFHPPGGILSSDPFVAQWTIDYNNGNNLPGFTYPGDVPTSGDRGEIPPGSRSSPVSAPRTEKSTGPSGTPSIRPPLSAGPG